MRTDLAKVPGYVAAVKRENDIRDAAFCDIPASICGFKVQQMTCWHWVILNAVESPLLSNRIPMVEDIAVFIWVLSPEFNLLRRLHIPLASKFVTWRRNKFIRKFFRMNPKYGVLVAKLKQFVTDTFQDSPPSSDTKGTDVPYYSFAASVVHSLASHYHWTEKEIMHLKLKRVFQYMKAIDLREQAMAGKTPVAFNPSDATLRTGRIKLRRWERKAKRGMEKVKPEMALSV